MVYNILKNNMYLLTVPDIVEAHKLIKKDKTLSYQAINDWEYYEPETEEEYQEMIEYQQRNW